MRLTLIVPMLALLACCGHLQPKWDYDHLITEAGNGATYLAYTRYPLWHRIDVRSRLKGDMPVDINQLVFIGEWSFQTYGIRWVIDGHPDFEDLISESMLQHHIAHSSGLLGKRNFHDKPDLTIRIGLVAENADVDYIGRSRFVSSPTLHFILPIDAESSNTIEYSFIQALGTVHHCAEITQSPANYVSEYLENGVPDKWREMVGEGSAQ